MGWKEGGREEARWALVERVRQGQSVAAASRESGVSRVTAHKWLKRARERGREGMEERAKRPRKLRWVKARGEWEDRLIKAHRKYPSWGSKKLMVYLKRGRRGKGVPSLSTIGRMLRELGLSRSRRWRRRGPKLPMREGRTAIRSNDVWAIDFKGCFHTLDGEKCDTLTITDLASRYVLCCQVMEATTLEAVREEVDKVFRHYGLPKVLRSDNGQPFGSPGPHRLSKLNVWWLKLGIEVEHTRPGHPADNGSHERMHRTLKADTQQPAASDVREQQRRYDRWRKYFNHERPHEALAMRVPASIYRSSRRRTMKPKPGRYPVNWEVRVVKGKGEISWQCQRRFIGEAFAGESVALKPINEKEVHVYFGKLLIGALSRTGTRGLRPSVFVPSSQLEC